MNRLLTKVLPLVAVVALREAAAAARGRDDPLTARRLGRRRRLGLTSGPVTTPVVGSALTEGSGWAGLRPQLCAVPAAQREAQ